MSVLFCLEIVSPKLSFNANLILRQSRVKQIYQNKNNLDTHQGSFWGEPADVAEWRIAMESSEISRRYDPELQQMKLEGPHAVSKTSWPLES
jgi:hypothetical protein